MCGGARGQPEVSFLRFLPLCFLRQTLSLLWRPQNRLGPAAHQVQDSFCPCLPSTGITSTCHHIQHFYMDSGNPTGPLMLVWPASPQSLCCLIQFVYSCHPLPYEVPVASLKPHQLDGFFPSCSESEDVRYMSWVGGIVNRCLYSVWLLSG